MAKKKIFFDLEFTGLHKLTTAISIGLVCEDGKKFYAEFTDYDKYQIDDFLRKEVFSKTTLDEYSFEKDYDPDAEIVYVKGSIDLIQTTLLSWLERYEEDGIEMWGDFVGYNWVLFINIFGNGLLLPKYIDHAPMDICTALNICGIEKDTDRYVFAYGEEIAKSNNNKKHNSLYDAETQLEVYKKLIDKMHEIMSLMQGENDEQVKEAYEQDKVDLQQTSDDIEVDNALIRQNEEFEIVGETQDGDLIVDTTPLENNAPSEEVVDFYEEEHNNKKPATKKKRGRPKKEEVTKKEVTSNVNAPKVDFIEPTQADIESSEEWNPPI
jgi:hypothetical protein